MKLEVGMYVRTKDGHIDKIKNIDEEYYCIEEDEEDKLYKIYQLNNTYYDDEFNEDNDWVFENFIIKASYNIIDILEVGDYVNGYIVEEIKRGYDGKIWIDNGTRDHDDGGKYTIWKRNEDIKSAITHEQMEQMAYKVGE